MPGSFLVGGIVEKRYVEVQSRGLTLRGYLELPDGASTEAPVPLLVMFHGFTGTLSEKHFVLSRLSRRVVGAGVATLRLDFGGSGESDGEFMDVTPLTEVEDGREILMFGCSLPETDPARVGLFGFSLGGFVAINVAVREQPRLKRLILMSPGMITHKKMERMFNENGEAGRGALRVCREFVSDGYSLEPLAAARTFQKPVSIVQGTRDLAVPPETAVAYQEAFPNAELTFVEGADHAYDRPDWFEGLSRAVVMAAKKL